MEEPDELDPDELDPDELDPDELDPVEPDIDALNAGAITDWLSIRPINNRVNVNLTLVNFMASTSRMVQYHRKPVAAYRQFVSGHQLI
jgi:hypothetical protein